MRVLARAANIFLILVGIEYVLLGIFILARGLGILPLVLINFGLVAPLTITSGNVCVSENAGGPVTPLNVSAPELLAYLAIAGGIIALVAGRDMWRMRARGYYIWFFFALVALVIAVWNRICTSSLLRFDSSIISFFWAVAYLAAFFITWWEYRKLHPHYL